MGGSHSVDFGVALEKTSYYSGEIISGYVQVKVLTDDVNVPELSVSLVGNAVTQVRYTTTTGTGENKRRVKETARQTLSLLKLNSKVRSIDKGRLVKGAQLQCPFAFVIPADAVPSMSALFWGRNTAEIKYQLSIYTTTPGKLFGTNTSCVHSVALNIVEAPPQLTAPPRVEDHAKVTRCCCIPAGTMQLAATASLSAIQPGDQLAVSVEVDNQSSQDVSYVNISVEQRISISARGHYHSSNTTITSTRVAGVARGAGFGFDRAQVVPEVDSKDAIGSQTGPRNVTLQVPALACFTTSSPTINVSYTLKVKAKTESTFVRDPKVAMQVHAYRVGPAAAPQVVGVVGESIGGHFQEGGDGADDAMVATVVGIEYAPNPDFVVEVIEPPIEATLVT